MSVFCFLFGTPSLAESHNTNPNANRFVFDINGIATELECSLISEIKERKLEIVAKGGKILFDMLSNETLRVSIGDKQVIKSTVTFIDGDFTKSASAFAGIDWNKKGMDYSQACGSAQSYATKYALCSLLLLSDSKLDPDSHKPKDYEDNSTDNQNNNFTLQNNNVNVDEIRNAESLDQLKDLYLKVQNIKSEKAKAFLTNELTKRKNKLLGIQQ